MYLSEFPKLVGLTKKKKRVGRGAGSGKGFHTTGKGTKGQKARTGHSLKSGFEGGQVPLYKKLPKVIGFNNPRSKKISVVDLSIFEKFNDGDNVTPDMILGVSLKKLPRHGVKILGYGTITKKLNFSGFLFSKSSKEKIEKVGGQVS
jgi:large subunit ribosomal protein L15